VPRLLSLFFLLWLAAASPAVLALDGGAGPPDIALADLPREARDTLALIRKGGPYPYAKDGSTFGNREHVLPKESHGFYREYTVKTPGSRNRGARRIICGGKQQRTCYYTGDHYVTFRTIRE
jgi:ribonuclease T1